MEAKVRISYGKNEVEIEGSEGFVREQLDKIDSLLGLFVPSDDAEGYEASAPSSTLALDPTPDPSKSTSAMPETFGEYLNQFKKTLNQEEQMLIAGYFVQKKSTDNSYTTKEANDLLKEQGIKVGNAAQAVTVAKNAKRVFALQRGKFRVSQPGVEYINTLQSN